MVHFGLWLLLPSIRLSNATEYPGLFSCLQTPSQLLLQSVTVPKMTPTPSGDIDNRVLSLRQEVESPGRAKRHFSAFDWPRPRSAWLGSSVVDWGLVLKYIECLPQDSNRLCNTMVYEYIWDGSAYSNLLKPFYWSAVAHRG